MTASTRVACPVTRLIDTNVLVYRFDPRDPEKQAIARDLLREGVAAGNMLLPQQALLEFVAAVTRPRADLGGTPLLERNDALAEVEALLGQFPVLWPDEAVLRTALYGFAAYRLSWFDAHLWAYAEVHRCAELVSEDFEHGRHLGRVRIFDPFLAAAGGVHELPPLYASE